MSVKNLRNFQVLVLRSGRQIFQSIVTPQDYGKIGVIASTFLTISDLEWFKGEVLKSRELNVRSYTGLNTFVCYVTGNTCEVGHESDEDDFDTVPTDIVLEYIDEAIAFRRLYESGGLLGIIPERKMNDWVIVPKEHVKEEYLKVRLSDLE